MEAAQKKQEKPEERQGMLLFEKGFNEARSDFTKYLDSYYGKKAGSVDLRERLEFLKKAMDGMDYGAFKKINEMMDIGFRPGEYALTAPINDKTIFTVGLGQYYALWMFYGGEKANKLAKGGDLPKIAIFAKDSGNSSYIPAKASMKLILDGDLVETFNTSFHEGIHSIGRLLGHRKDEALREFAAAFAIDFHLPAKKENGRATGLGTNNALLSRHYSPPEREWLFKSSYPEVFLICAASGNREKTLEYIRGLGREGKLLGLFEAGLDFHIIRAQMNRVFNYEAELEKDAAKSKGQSKFKLTKSKETEAFLKELRNLPGTIPHTGMGAAEYSEKLGAKMEDMAKKYENAWDAMVKIRLKILKTNSEFVRNIPEAAGNLMKVYEGMGVPQEIREAADRAILEATIDSFLGRDSAKAMKKFMETVEKYKRAPDLPKNLVLESRPVKAGSA